MDVNLIVAYDKCYYGIGKDGQIPWKNKTDMKWFKSVTTGKGNNAVVMGRKTYESIGKPLPDRLNIILSSSMKSCSDYMVTDSLINAINIAKDLQKDNLFIIGGKTVYEQAKQIKYLIDNIFIDELDTGLTNGDFDTFYKPDLTGFKSLKYKIYNFDDETVDMNVYYNTYDKHDTNDFNYLNLIVDILNNGRPKQTRAGETLSVFNRQVVFDLRQGLPILTTKKIYSKACIHELLWFLKGSDNIKYLVENNIHIWDDDAYRFYLEIFKNILNENEIKSKEEFLEAVKHDTYRLYVDNNESLCKYRFGDVGPIYGSQWINWYGINQLNDVIKKLKTNPYDRRIMISAWNVSDISKMALPPCHYMCQFYVDEMTHEERVKEYEKLIKTTYTIDPNTITKEQLDEEHIPTQYLSCMWQQRSVDTCLGLPFDILSYSIFLSMVAKVCNMIPYKLIGTLGDTHIYKNQIDNITEQLTHNPFKYDYAQLKLEDKDNIYDFTYDDIKITDYKSYPSIKYILSVGL